MSLMICVCTFVEFKTAVNTNPSCCLALFPRAKAAQSRGAKCESSPQEVVQEKPEWSPETRWNAHPATGGL